MLGVDILITQDVLLTLYLCIYSTVQSVSQGWKGVSAILGIEVRPGSYAVLSRVRRRAVAQRQVIMLEIIVPKKKMGVR